jgi:hypothetical protein
MEGNERRRKEGSRMISARSMARREDHRFNESERVRMREEKSEGENENTEYLRKEEVMAQPKTAPSSSLQQPRLRQGVHVPTLPKLVFFFGGRDSGRNPSVWRIRVGSTNAGKELRDPSWASLADGRRGHPAIPLAPWERVSGDHFADLGLWDAAGVVPQREIRGPISRPFPF